ncbi:MAG: hydroxyacid dehydrogenase [Rubrobacteridae bacterium]|nr:hydroxyacid dehydrogenase [Rubrobacteridae bacterium]
MEQADGDRTKVAFFEAEHWEEDYITEKLDSNFDFAFFKEPLSQDNVDQAKEFEVISPFIYSEIDRSVIEQLPKLRLIATRSTGFDHIDVRFCVEKNIAISNVPTYGTNTVAEHTFALILALSRKILPSVERTRRGNFNLENLMGFDLKNRTLGVVGAGHIGQNVIKIGHGFQMDILVYDTKLNQLLAKELDFKYASLNDLLEKSDVITLHAPYNPHTHHMINRKNIGLIKRGAIVINTSRGGLIETAALVEALQKGKLAGVGLDVIEEEGLIKEERELLSHKREREELQIALESHLLLFRDDAIITPHNAFNSKEAVLRILDTTISNIESFVENKPQNTIILKAA